jgi:hypothetical protein
VGFLHISILQGVFCSLWCQTAISSLRWACMWSLGFAALQLVRPAFAL